MWLHLVEGEPVAHALDDGFDRRVDFGLVGARPRCGSGCGATCRRRATSRCSPWCRRCPSSRSRAAARRSPSTRTSIARLLELGRPVPRRDEPPDDGAPADLSAVTGRYVRVELETGARSSSAEQAGEGRDLLFLHTAGSDGRQYHHLLADPELRSAWRMTAFDLPAHGRSTPPSGLREGEWLLTTDRYVETIVACADALALERPVAARLLDGRRDLPRARVPPPRPLRRRRRVPGGPTASRAGRSHGPSTRA